MDIAGLAWEERGFSKLVVVMEPVWSWLHQDNSLALLENGFGK